MQKKNKWFMGGMAALSCALALVLAGCGTMSRGSGGGGGSGKPAERVIRGNTPQFVKDAVKNAPENAYIGIGTAKLATVGQSRTFAATRGRAEISRQILTLMQDMVRDYTASSEVDPSAALAYQENFTLALSKSAMSGSSVVEEDSDDKGAYWVVVVMRKDGAAKEINQASAQAKLKVPAMAALDAEKRMNEAFDRLDRQEIQVRDKD